MKTNPSIFRTYDVRGVYGQDFDAQFAQQLGSRVTGYLKNGTVIVGRDARASSDELTYALIDGAVHAGAQVVDLGVVSSPQMYFAVRALGGVGGIMVTASHNPDQYNGFKIIANQGAALDIIGGDHLRQIYDSHQERHGAHGAIERHDIVADYAAAIAYAAKWRGGSELRMAVDAPAAVRRVLEQLGPIAPDDALGVKFDADGDRIEWYVGGRLIPADCMFLLLTERLHLRPVVFDTRFSRTVRSRLDIAQVPYSVSRSGRLCMTRAMQRSSAVFGGEISGHYYWKEFNNMEAPELALLRVYDIIRTSGRTLDTLVAPYRVLFKEDALRVPVRDAKHAISLLHALAERFHDGTQHKEDGLTVEYPDWWFNARPSNTEPLLRLTVEADTAHKLLEKSHLLLDVLQVRVSD